MMMMMMKVKTIATEQQRKHDELLPLLSYLKYHIPSFPEYLCKRKKMDIFRD